MGEIAGSSAVSEGEERMDYSSVIQPIEGVPAGKNFLYMEQLNPDDIAKYISEAYEAQAIIEDPSRGGINLLPYLVLKAIMRQPSTRTGGSMTTAMKKLGGSAELISGMGSSSEEKGETVPDSWVAFAAQADIIGVRTKEDYGPAVAARAIDQAYRDGKLVRRTLVFNLGDGKRQHPTQAMGDLFTIHRRFKELEGLKIAIVGDHERYRAHHSLMIGAAAVGMEIIAVESKVAPVPESIIETVGPRLIARQYNLDTAMAEADVLYMGRNPDEYDGDDDKEKARSRQLAADFEAWHVNHARLQRMKSEAIVLHPRPRRDELSPDVDCDPRMADIEQMSNMIPMRMAIIALHAGKSIIEANRDKNAKTA
jgi:aspartate carbamoyltransferase catalytic subunit